MSASSPAGTRIADRYAIVEVLGQGSFGRTYLARDEREGERLVAIKQLHAQGSDLFKRYELFEREAAVLGALRHQGIPAIYDHLRVEREGGEDAYLVMEYIEGASLAALIERRHHFDAVQLTDLLLGLLDILDYLHARVPPVLHRDIKPANVIVRPSGAPALVDFGAVRNVFKAADEGGSTIVGTFGYMPFEQYMGQAGPASDLYAVGATFLHLVTGRPPTDFAGPDGAVRVPEGLPGGDALRGVLVRLLAPAASERVPSARAAREALLGGLAGGAAAPVQLALRVKGSTALEPASAGLTGRRAEAFEKLALSPLQLMFYWRKPTTSPALIALLTALVALFSLGIVPLIYGVMYRSRRARLEHFFTRGEPAEARVLRIDNRLEHYEVAYEFKVGGVAHRGLDKVIPAVARSWQPGDQIQVLYIADEDHDSVVVNRP